jgi:hypothetical protein
MHSLRGWPVLTARNHSGGSPSEYSIPSTLEESCFLKFIPRNFPFREVRARRSGTSRTGTYPWRIGGLVGSQAGKMVGSTGLSGRGMLKANWRDGPGHPLGNGPARCLDAKITTPYRMRSSGPSLLNWPAICRDATHDDVEPELGGVRSTE